jgi:hypothetical protein
MRNLFKRENIEIFLFIMALLVILICMPISLNTQYNSGWVDGYERGFAYAEELYENNDDYQCAITYTGEGITDCRCVASWVWWNHG